MQKFAHYIKENKSVTVPKRLICFDTETSQHPTKDGKTEQRFKLGVAVHQRIRHIDKPPKVDWLETHNAPQLCEWILSKAVSKERLYVISANIWFDIRTSGMLGPLHKQGWKIHKLFVNGMVLIISFKKNGKTLVFLNFQNYFRVSVEVMGECLGFPKLKIDFNNVSIKDLMTYCRRDTEIIWRAMNSLFRFIKKKELGNFGFTFPAIAFNVYRHKFMHNKLLVHIDEKVIELERNCYFGGRTEAFKIGEFTNKNLVQIDINSMYPFVMKHFESPCILKYHNKNLSVSVLHSFLENHCCCAHVAINTNEPVYPVRLKGKCVFPIGEFETYLTTASLKYAFSMNHIVAVKEAAFYTKDFIFSEYVDYFHTLKKEYTAAQNVPFSTLCKYLLNGLYGKFGQRGDKVISEIECDYDKMTREAYFDADLNKHYITTAFFGKCITIEKSVQEGLNSIVSIAAHVTDHSRMYLWSFLKRIGRINTYYCDTDCIIFDQDAFDPHLLPIDATKLGYFKIEKEATCITLNGLKDYEFAGNTHIKGVSKKATKLSENIYSQHFFPGIYSDLHEGINKPYTTYNKTKTLTREYTKGTVLSNGDVAPLKLTILA